MYAAALRADHEAPSAGRAILVRPTPLDLLRSQGYVIFERLVSRELIQEISRELEPWFAATPRCRGDFYGWHTTRLGALLLKSLACQQLVLHELVLSVVGQVLGPSCDWYQLNLSQAVRIHPGERQQVPHRDDVMWPRVQHGLECAVNVMWALSDFTADNGATLLWPRSQFHAPSRRVEPVEAVAAEMPCGSALVYLGSLTHCGGANRTQLPRTGVTLSYCLGWLKQYENAFLTYPPHVAYQFRKEIRDLLGYRIHRPNLGGYEGQDPAVLFETNSHALPAVDCISEAGVRELQEYHRNAGASSFG